MLAQELRAKHKISKFFKLQNSFFPKKESQRNLLKLETPFNILKIHKTLFQQLKNLLFKELFS